MDKFISSKDLQNILVNREFSKEEEIRDLVAEKLPSLLKIDKHQIKVEPLTTSFDFTLSNRADILVKTPGEFNKIILVIECKLHISVENFKESSYVDATKQLHKYCQDVRAPYGILLSDKFCAIWHYKYFEYDKQPERVEENKIPEVKKIMEEMALSSMMDVVAHPKTKKYFYLLFIIAYALGYVGSLMGIYLKKLTNPIFILVETTFVIISAYFLIKDIKE